MSTNPSSSPPPPPALSPEPTPAPSPRTRRRRPEGERTRAQRAKERHFSKVSTFDTTPGGFVPLPIIFRALLWSFNPRTWMVLTAVMMRCTKEQITWFTLAELGHDLDYKNKGKLRTHLDTLVTEGFLAHAEEGGTEYWCAVDPIIVVEQMVESSKLSPSRIANVNFSAHPK